MDRGLKRTHSQPAASAQPEAPLLAGWRLADAAVQDLHDRLELRAAVGRHQQLLHAQQDEAGRQRLGAPRNALEVLRWRSRIVGREEACDVVPSRIAACCEDPAAEQAALSLPVCISASPDLNPTPSASPPFP
jgi:hypothetical protein